jgi:hypothetical protein
VSNIEGCPGYRGVQLEGFYCIFNILPVTDYTNFFLSLYASGEFKHWVHASLTRWQRGCMAENVKIYNSSKTFIITIFYFCYKCLLFLIISCYISVNTTTFSVKLSHFVTLFHSVIPTTCFGQEMSIFRSSTCLHAYCITANSKILTFALLLY